MTDFPQTHPARLTLTRVAQATLFPLLLLALAAPVFAGTFGPGNVLVVRVGDGASTLSSAAAPVFLEEFTATGAHVQTIALPTAAGPGIHPFTNAGSATSEGFLNFSTNGLYVCHGGYAAAPGLAAVAGTTSATVPRVISVIDLNGNVMTRTALTDTFSGGNIRSVTSTDGTDYWLAGSNGGVRHTTFGSSTSTQLNTSLPTNLRVVRIHSGQLYVSSASGAFQGVSTVGTGLPTTPAQTITILPGFPTVGTASAYDYHFADAQTLYVADDRPAPSGGIQKWIESAGTWTLQYTLNPPVGSCRGLTGTTLGGLNVLFATTTQSNANTIVRVVDTGVAAAFTTLATAATNTAFRGIRLTPPVCAVGPDCNMNGLGDACDIQFGLSSDLNENGIPDDCEQNGGTQFCFGDTGCPCGNNVPPGSMQGCAWGPFIGATLTGAGNTSVSSDTLTLNARNLPVPPLGSSSILFFQGDTPTSMPFNDGKRCAAGTMVRLGIKTYSGPTSSYPQVGDPSISVRGMIPGAGGSFVYQAWFRVFPSFCDTGSNLTNAVSAVWMP